MAGGRRAVFLDRDGVLVRAAVKEGVPVPPGSLEEAVILPGVRQALCRFRRAGYLLIVVTNQPDVARGKTRRDAVEAINAKLVDDLGLDAIEVCYHDDGDGCDCRKPAPGMLLRRATPHGIDLARSFMIGDRWRDIEAGIRAGCITVLVGDGYGEHMPRPPAHRVESLSAAAELILNHDPERSRA